MRCLTLAAIAMLTSPALAQTPAVDTDACTFDEAALIVLPFDKFDQDFADGWRPLAQRPECLPELPHLLATYRAARSADLEPDQFSLLEWHEAQLRANLGETEVALDLFARAGPDEAPGQRREAFGLYREATITFLKRDRDALQSARDRLAALPMPDWFLAVVVDSEQKFGLKPTWPMNLDVVDGFITCFGRPYSEAYGANCRPRPPG
jgi:hypothetical protein